MQRDATIHHASAGIADRADSSSPGKSVESRQLGSGGIVLAIAEGLRIFKHDTAEDRKANTSRTRSAETKFTVARIQHRRDVEPRLEICSESGA